MVVQKITLEARSMGESKRAAGLRPEGIPKKEEGETGLGERGKEGGVIDLNLGMFSRFFSFKSPFSAERSSVKDGVKKEKGDLRSDVSSAMARDDNKQRQNYRKKERQRQVVLQILLLKDLVWKKERKKSRNEKRQWFLLVYIYVRLGRKEEKEQEFPLLVILHDNSRGF
jgi:hypothetical protein